jgi:ribonuclease HI
MDIELWTDGACEPNPGQGGCAAVIVWGESICYEVSRGFESTTNNRMEIMGVIIGLEKIKEVGPDGVKRINLYSDSKYVVNAIDKWMFNWKRNGWRRKGGQVKNLELWVRLDKLMQKLPLVKPRWVRGHAGNELNERADELAVHARRSTDKSSDTSSELDCLTAKAFAEAWLGGFSYEIVSGGETTSVKIEGRVRIVFQGGKIKEIR